MKNVTFSYYAIVWEKNISYKFKCRLDPVIIGVLYPIVLDSCGIALLYYCLMFRYIMQAWVSNIFSIFNSMALINYLTSPFLSSFCSDISLLHVNSCTIFCTWSTAFGCPLFLSRSQCSAEFLFPFMQCVIFSLSAFKISSLYLTFSSLNGALRAICLYLFCL